MNMHDRIRGILIAVLFGCTISAIQAQSVNIWRGGTDGADWNDRYKWNLKHPPQENEAAYFRSENSLIKVNSTVELNNGMHIYGQELTLTGNGNINLLNPVEHQQTVNIPASADGFANMTLNDTLALSGRIALSAKAFGTSASKGSITLQDRSSATGKLVIGNAGSGSGRVYVKDNATYRITGLELATKSETGGSAEIHVLGGTVRIETTENPFTAFLGDSSRKIVIGKAGTLRIESELPIGQKKDYLKKLISNRHLLAAPGARLTLPVVQDKMVLIRAEDERMESELRTKELLLSAIDRIPEGNELAPAVAASPGLGSVLSNMRTSSVDESSASATAEESGSAQMAGYMVFFGVALLAFRRANGNDE